MNIRHPFEWPSTSAQKRSFVVLLILTLAVMLSLQVLDRPLKTKVTPSGIVSFGVEDGEIVAFLAERGFGMVSHCKRWDLESKNLTTENGALFGRINGPHSIGIASVS